MRNGKLALLLIGQALIWAAVMIGIREELGDASYAGGIEYLLIGGWFLSHMLTISMAASLRRFRAELTCIQRRFRALQGSP